MSHPTLRQRKPVESNGNNPLIATNGTNENTELALVPISELSKRSLKPRKRRLWLIFVLGGLFGIFVAGFLANKNDVIDFEALVELADFNFDSISNILPPGILKEAKELSKQERAISKVGIDSFSVGLHLQAKGLAAHHPVIMIPGVISTGLESWGTGDGSRQYFRKRLWGSWTMMRALVLDKANWKRHIMLDKYTGLDPSGIKLRAAQGFDAADFFVTGYWIWSKILENLAAIGYDPTNAFTAAYDWRLSYSNLEVRDQYFTRLQTYIETARKISGKKTVLVSHSMGSQVLLYFFHWVQAAKHADGSGGGGGGPSWVDEHIDSWINVSGCLLGALKDVPAVLSGEMKDTAQLNAFAVYGLEKFLSREERAEIFRAMPGLSSMLPKGGDLVWGNHTWAPDDADNQTVSFGRFINFRDTNSSTQTRENLTIRESLDYLLEHSDPWYQAQLLRNYSHGVAHTREQVEANEHDPRKWVNPLETALPYAPNLKIFCFYGINKPTERSYYYRESPLSSSASPLIDTATSVASNNDGDINNNNTDNNNNNDDDGDDDDNGNDSTNTTLSDRKPKASNRVNITIDTAFNIAPADHGVVLGEGDGTVPLLSNGYMCARGWRDFRRYNPGGAKIVTYEMPHEPDRFNPRGGPNTGDHVDILGRQSLNDLILRVAAGRGDDIEEFVASRIREYAERVKIYDD
ncbi:MAG: hypothetical protein M1825_004203 [Sarcosagium campestre]|nr:MAG: hypothetical protein M1825_004203 [Sarcosagium campestre]